MLPLEKVLKGIYNIPKQEFAAGLPAGQRPNEMAFIRQILSSETERNWRRCNVTVKRACYRNSDCFVVLFQILNGSTHEVKLTFYPKTKKVYTSVDGKPEVIDTLTGLQQRMRQIASHK